MEINHNFFLDKWRRYSWRINLSRSKYFLIGMNWGYLKELKLNFTQLKNSLFYNWLLPLLRKKCCCTCSSKVFSNDVKTIFFTMSSSSRVFLVSVSIKLFGDCDRCKSKTLSWFDIVYSLRNRNFDKQTKRWNNNMIQGKLHLIVYRDVRRDDEWWELSNDTTN